MPSIGDVPKRWKSGRVGPEVVKISGFKSGRVQSKSEEGWFF